jgi:endonuclease/exonuclease/phosphatase family metal-dependent hydrolase
MISEMSSAVSSNRFLPPDDIEFGGQSLSEDQRRSRPSRLVLASYNIRYGVGPSLVSSGLLRKLGMNLPRPRAEAIRRNLRATAQAFLGGTLLPKPDLLAIQEADKLTQRAGALHVAAELAGLMGLPYIHAPAGIPRGTEPIRRQWWLDFEEQIGLHDAGDTGIALIAGVPLRDVIRIDLPWHDCPWRPRLAMAATVSLADSQLRLFNAHIDPHASLDGQYGQLNVILTQADQHPGPTVILGDLNTLFKEKAIETRRFLESHGYMTPFPTGTATWRGAGLRLHSDWIFVRGVIATRWGVARALKVSDHWPVWAEVAPQGEKS